MTNSTRIGIAAPRRRPSTRTTTVKVTLASLAAAAVIAAGLAVQMADGHDPALGSGQKAKVHGAAPAHQTPPTNEAQAAPAPPPDPVVTSTS